MSALLDAYPWILPFVIFFGRICDVSLGTLRIVLVARGEKKLAPIVGFVEVFIWIVIIAQVFSRANDLLSYAAYAAGYATGTYVGMLVEARLGLGFVIYRVFTMQNGLDLSRHLHQSGFGATMTHGQGSVSEIDIIEAVIARKNIRALEAIIHDFDPNAFYVVEDVRAKQRGFFTRPSKC